MSSDVLASTGVGKSVKDVDTTEWEFCKKKKTTSNVKYSPSIFSIKYCMNINYINTKIGVTSWYQI